MAMAMKSVNQAMNEDSTVETEESSVYDTILSTCCCGGSASGQNSITKNESNKKKGQPEPKVEEDIEQPRKFWERVSDMALYLIGGAPPVKFVKCFECSSVDGSEVTMPRVLDELASEYDKDNKWRVNSMWSISEDISDRQISALDTTSSDNMLNPPPTAAEKKRLSQSRRIGSSRRRLRLRSSGTKASKSSKSLDTRSTAMSTTITADDSYLLKNRISAYGGSPSNMSKQRSGVGRPKQKSTKSTKKSRRNVQTSMVRIEI